MTHLKDVASTSYFQPLYHDHINTGVYFPLGESLQLYLWLCANSFWGPTTDSYEHVGHWVQRGLIVSRFSLKEFGDQVGKDPKTVGRWLQRIEDHGFGIRLQVGGDIRADGKRTPALFAVGAWSYGLERQRVPHYVGWTNALTGRDGLITTAELEAHLGKLDDKNAQKRAQLAQAREKWALMRLRSAVEEGDTRGQTNLSHGESAFWADESVCPSQTKSSGGYLDDFRLDNKDINTLAELRSATPGEGQAGGLGRAEQRKAKDALQGVSVGEPGVGVGGRRNNVFAPETAVDVEGEVAAAAPRNAAKRSTAYARPTPSPAPSQPSGSVQAPTSHEEVPEALVEAPVAKKPRKPSAKVSEGFKYPAGVHKAMVDSIAQVCFPEGGVTKGHWSLIGTKASELLDAGYAAEEIPLIAQFLLKDQFWSQKLTPTVIVSQAPRWKSSGAKRPIAQPARNITPKSAITPEMQARLDAANADEKARTEELIRRGGRR